MASEKPLWPLLADAPSDADLSRCVHCGLCLNACPTYLITGLEVESPRGRIHMAKLVSDGRSELTASIQAHWELCLQCRACEAICPSGVPYGRIQEGARAQLDAAAPVGRKTRGASGSSYCGMSSPVRGCWPPWLLQLAGMRTHAREAS
ncbi:MAG: 4Fe-4S dicluster domain-containing protein [Dehalococcoidia bacterium]|nr:4Fe-4S dicluster domain-containing protein [Dehalococcoidia bacterium]